MILSKAFGIDPLEHDIRFVEDDWESPTLGAWGLGWEVWLDGMEVTQFTYFQQAGSIDLSPVSVELTYGLERIAMYLQGVDNVYDLEWTKGVSYGDVHHKGEWEHSTYNFEVADIDMLWNLFESYEKEAKRALDMGLVLPGYDYCLKCSHTFNLLEARGAISVTPAHGLHRPHPRHGPQGRRGLCEPAPGDGPSAPEKGGGLMAQLLFEIGHGRDARPFRGPGHRADEPTGPKALGQRRVARRRFGYQGLLAPPGVWPWWPTAWFQRQPDMEEQFLGPPKANAFDANGNPTKAALGFAKSQGVEVGQLKVIDTAKGERLGYIKQVPGQDAEAVLPGILQKIVESLHFPKSMRWGAEQFRFARPIHWFVALLDGKVVPIEMTGIKSGNQTRGHRFMAPEAIEVTGGADYVEKLRQAHVLVDRDERIAATRAEVDKAAQEAGFNLLDDETLLLENADLVEQPTACCGTFDAQFLEVPPGGRGHGHARTSALSFPGRRPGQAYGRVHRREQHQAQGSGRGHSRSSEGPAGPAGRRPVLPGRRP